MRIESTQYRVQFHAQRLFRQAGGRGIVAHFAWIEHCKHAGLGELISAYSLAQCVLALQLIERAAADAGLNLFRDTRTQWEELTQ